MCLITKVTICIYLEAEMECFDISLHKISKKSTWTFGSCSSSLEFTKAGVYTEKCCISPGVHILSCNDPFDDDWSRRPLILQGHEFCNDYVGKTAIVQLNLTGTNRSKGNCTFRVYGKIDFFWKNN